MVDQSQPDVAALLPSLLRYARMLTRDDAAAEDLLHDALLRAHERRASFRQGGALKPWLLAIVHNIFVSGCRRTRTEDRARDVLAGMTDGLVAPAQENATYLRQIATRFDRLPDFQREALHLVAVEGLSYREAADALGVPVGTVMSRLSRARAWLREEGDAQMPALRIVGGRNDG